MSWLLFRLNLDVSSIPGTCALTLPKPTISGEGGSSVNGLSGLYITTTIDADGLIASYGSSAVQLLPPSIDADGILVPPATGGASLSLPEPSISGEGEIRFNVFGEASFEIAQPSGVDAYGALAIDGVGTVISTPLVAGIGNLELLGVATVGVSEPSILGLGDAWRLGVVTCSAASPAVSISTTVDLDDLTIDAASTTTMTIAASNTNSATLTIAAQATACLSIAA